MADTREPEDDIDGIEDEADEGLDEGSDAGQIDDQGGDEADGHGQGYEDEEAQARVARAPRNDRIKDELRALREHNARVEREIQELRNTRNQPQGPREETDAEFQARVSLLDSEQRMDAKLERAERQHRQHLALQSFALADRMDKANYDRVAASDPIYRKYAAEVERVLEIERRKGRDFDRETVLDFVRGRNARMNKTKSVAPNQQRRAPAQQTRTTGGRGDQPREQRQRRFAANDMSPEAVRARLESPDAYI